MTHEELVEKVGRGLAHRHMLSSGTSEILHWSLFEDEAREANRITGEALYQSIRERMAAIEYCKPSELTPACTINLRSVDKIFKSLTQGNTP